MATLPFFLNGCGDVDPRAIKTFPEMSYGDRVDLTPVLVSDYFIIDSTPYKFVDDHGTVYKIVLTYTTYGYYALSYYVDSIECEYTFDWLGDDGNIHTSSLTITVNPNKNGDSSKMLGTEVNYRSVKNFRISDYRCEGFVVKK